MNATPLSRLHVFLAPLEVHVLLNGGIERQLCVEWKSEQIVQFRRQIG